MYEKRNYSVSLNPENVEKLREECMIDNLSGWIDAQIQQAVENKTNIKQCPCGVIAGVMAWKRWLDICPECKSDHIKLDRRKLIDMKGN
jgi:hypothetical protein